MAIVTAFAASAATPVPPIPPPLEQETANCMRPTYASDILVCSRADLRMADEELRARLIRLQPQFAPPWWEPQDAWFRRRSLCAFSQTHERCIIDAYSERSAILDSLSAPATGPATMVRCSAPMIAAIRNSGTATIIEGATGQTIGVAFAPRSFSNWKPFATVTTRGRRVLIVFADGQRITCRSEGLKGSDIGKAGGSNATS